MAKVMKHRGQMFFIMCMVIALLATACSSNSGSTGKEEASGNTPVKESEANKGGVTDPYDGLPKKLSISMFDRGSVSSDEGTYEDNRWVKWIREQSGIDLTIIPVARNQAQDKLNILFAS
ncbi:MAG TPA: hypothetical protein VGN02_11325, partial [Paenibacillus sp.]